MRAFDRVTSSSPGPTLFHYTTQTGLLGILTTNSLWATKIHYLNDSSEYNSALGLAADHLNGLLEHEADGVRRATIEALKASITGITNLNICVASFSTNGDLLSQWRAYGGGSGGYSLEFQTACLLEWAAENSFVLAQCVYDDHVQRDLIADLIAEVLEAEFDPSTVSDSSPFYPGLKTGSSFAYHLGRLASILKNKSFQEEDEWRLVSRARMVQTMRFREGRSMLVPYYEFPLGAEKVKYLASVTVGPTPHMELAKNAVTMLLYHHGVMKPCGSYGPQPIDVHSSKVPFRNW